MQVGFGFGCMEDFQVQYVFYLLPALHLNKQFSDFLNIFQCSPCWNNIFYKERWEFGQADHLQRFNDNDNE